MAGNFSKEAIAAEPGWFRWQQAQPSRFNTAVVGPLKMCKDGDAARVRMDPREHHLNEIGTIHGGATLGFIDTALFAAIHLLLDIDPTATLTIDLSTQFVGAGSGHEPLDAVVEVLRETGRLIFLRGTVEQSHGVVAAFSATVRKPTRS